MNLRSTGIFLEGVFQRTVGLFLPLPKRFLVISSGRSGSNLLLSLLRSHPAIRHHGEITGESRLCYGFIKKEISLFGPKSYPRRCFRRVGFESLSGIKVLYNNFTEDYANRMSVNPDVLHQIRDYLRSNTDIKVIHLKRRNRLKVMISSLVAYEAQQYVLVDGDNRTDELQIEVSADRLTQSFESMGAFEDEADEIFENHNKLEVYYEDLTAQKDDQCNRILDFLDIKRQPLHTEMKKQIKRPMSETLKNYDDLKIQFSGTKWESFFTD